MMLFQSLTRQLLTLEKSFVEMLGRATTLTCGAAGSIFCLCLTITSWMWTADYILIFYTVDHLIYIYKPY